MDKNKIALCYTVGTAMEEGKCANLCRVDLIRATLYNADLSRADLGEVLNLNIEQLSEVETLYEAKLDPELMEQVKDKYPHLLEEPKSEE